MKKSAAFLLILALAACGRATGPTANVARSVNEVDIANGMPVTTADLSISGMTCAMMCGGAIKDAMAKLPGVSNTEIKFAETGTSHAVVTYDPAKVSDTEMVSAIQQLNEGQYKVLAVGITKQVLKSGASDAPVNGTTAQQVNASAVADVVLPSLVALLSRLMHI